MLKTKSSCHGFGPRWSTCSVHPLTDRLTSLMLMAPFIFTSETRAYFGWIRRSQPRIRTDSSRLMVVDRVFHAADDYAWISRMDLSLPLFRQELRCNPSHQLSTRFSMDDVLAQQTSRRRDMCLWLECEDGSCWVDESIESILSIQCLTRQSNGGLAGRTIHTLALVSFCFCMNLIMSTPQEMHSGWTDKCIPGGMFWLPHWLLLEYWLLLMLLTSRAMIVLYVHGTVTRVVPSR